MVSVNLNQIMQITLFHGWLENNFDEQFKDIIFLLILTFPTQSEELNFRGSSAQIINKDEIKIRISDEMLKLDSFKGFQKIQRNKKLCWFNR